MLVNSKGRIKQDWQDTFQKWALQKINQNENGEIYDEGP